MFPSFYSADDPDLAYCYPTQLESRECLPSCYVHRQRMYENESPSVFLDMKPGTTWAERGADGKTYFVRKKSKLPSARELIADALTPRRIHSLPFSKVFRKNFHILPAPEPVSNPLALQTPASSTPINTNSTCSLFQLQNPPHHISFQSQHPPHHMMYSNHFRPPPPLQLQESTNTRQNEGNTLKPEPQRYQFPHPSMYPIPPPGVQFGPPPLQFGPTNPHQHLPPGARLISPPRFPTPDDLKYKCSVCGKFRSPRYHYKHPIPPGELPAKTTCRRCRKEATDSEDEYSSESLRPRRLLRRRQLSRSRSRAPVRIVTEPTASRRARSSSRVEFVSRSRSRSLGRQSRRYDSYSRSSSRETGQVRIAIEDRPRRRRSRSVEIVRRYIEDRPSRRSSFEEETVYVDNPRRYRSSSTYYEPYHPSDEEYDYPGRLRIASRAPTPMPRMIRRQYSDPYIRAPVTVERREYYDGPNSVVGERSVLRPRRPVSRASSKDVRIVSQPQYRPQIHQELSPSEEEYQVRNPTPRQYHHEGDWYANRGRPRSHSRRERSRSRLSRFDGEDDHGHPHRQPRLARAPSSPSATGTSSLGYIEPQPYNEEVEVARTVQHDAVDRRGRPATITRKRRSRSRSVLDAEQAATFLRPGDHVTVVERREAAPERDYEWYDNDGMKVRVREI